MKALSKLNQLKVLKINGSETEKNFCEVRMGNIFLSFTNRSCLYIHFTLLCKKNTTAIYLLDPQHYTKRALYSQTLDNYTSGPQIEQHTWLSIDMLDVLVFSDFDIVSNCGTSTIRLKSASFEVKAVQLQLHQNKKFSLEFQNFL